MDAAVFGFIGVVVGGIVTGFFTIRAERIRADKEAALDSAKRQDDRRLGRDNFQRETLVALQAAVNDLARASHQIHFHDSMSFKTTGAWGRAPVDPGVDAAGQQTAMRVTTLRANVADDGARSLAESLTTAYWSIATAKDKATSDAALDDLQSTATRLLERSGELIRQTFRAD